MLLESRCSEYGFFAHDKTRVYSNTEQTQGCLVGSCDSSGSGKRQSQEQHEEAHGTVCIVVQGRLMRCAPEHLRHLSERESLSLDREKGVEEPARTFTDIVQDFKFSKGTHVDLRRCAWKPPFTLQRFPFQSHLSLRHLFILHS